MGKHSIVGFGVSMLFVGLVIETVHIVFPMPKWDPAKQSNSVSAKVMQTDKNTGAWRGQNMEEFMQTQKKWASSVFLLSSVMGIAALLIGSLIIKIPGVSGGLMGGGILTIIGGYIPAQMADIGSPWKLAYLLGILGLLIWLGSRKFGNLGT